MIIDIWTALLINENADSSVKNTEINTPPPNKMLLMRFIFTDIGSILMLLKLTTYRTYGKTVYHME